MFELGGRVARACLKSGYFCRQLWKQRIKLHRSKRNSTELRLPNLRSSGSSKLVYCASGLKQASQSCVTGLNSCLMLYRDDMLAEHLSCMDLSKDWVS